MTEDQKKQLELAITQLKDGYAELGKIEIVVKDLRTFCAINPKDMIGGNNNVDPNKAMAMTGRAMVYERIDYFVNTPVEQIIKDQLNKYGA